MFLRPGSVIDGTGPLALCFDHYAKPLYYGAVKSGDLVRWQENSDRVSFPNGARHGTVLRVPAGIVENIQSRTKLP
jgi:hypothetical protein